MVGLEDEGWMGVKPTVTLAVVSALVQSFTRATEALSCVDVSAVLKSRAGVL